MEAIDRRKGKRSPGNFLRCEELSDWTSPRKHDSATWRVGTNRHVTEPEGGRAPTSGPPALEGGSRTPAARSSIPPAQVPAKSPVEEALTLVIRVSRKMLLHLQPAAVSSLSLAHDLAELPHQVADACEALVALLRRDDVASRGEFARIAGRAYIDGRLSIEEVASLLGEPHGEAVALLETHGYRREEGDLVKAAKARWKANALRRAAAMEAAFRLVEQSEDLPTPATDDDL